MTLNVYNLLGEEVITLLSGHLLSGFYSFEFDASDLASGLYFYRLSAGSMKGVVGEYVQSRKMVLIK